MYFLIKTPLSDFFTDFSPNSLFQMIHHERTEGGLRSARRVFPPDLIIPEFNHGGGIELIRSPSILSSHINKQ